MDLFDQLLSCCYLEKWEQGFAILKQFERDKRTVPTGKNSSSTSILEVAMRSNCSAKFLEELLNMGANPNDEVSDLFAVK
jgi:hypothetical protein